MKKKIRMSLILLIALVASACSIHDTCEFFIAPDGSSSNKGNKSNPFSTLEDARDAISQLKKNNQLPKDTITVWLREGIYELGQTFLLQIDDSGFEDAPIVFTAYPGEKVILSGGKRIGTESAKPISQESALQIIEKEAIPRIREIDLAALGISDYGINRITGFRRPYVNAAMELFINGIPYHLSRYPNKEKILIKTGDVLKNGFINDREFYPGEIRFSKDKLAQWTNAGNIITCGNFSFAWATDQLRVKDFDAKTGVINFADSHMFPITDGNEWNQIYFFNLMEEIDDPGEYYIDHQKGKLYFYPFEELKSSDTIMVSMLEDALVTLKGACHIQFKNITFEAGRGIGIYMENTESNKIENCTIRNMGVVGVCIGMGSKPGNIYRHPDHADRIYPDEKLSERIGSLHELIYENTTFDREGGKNNGIISCKIENTGCGGISIGGGNRLTLEPADNYVYNCEFTDCGRRDYSYKAPVNIDGVGNKVQHCRFNPCPATAIYIHGNNHLIEYNVISEACNFMEDQGSIYIGRDPSEFGNVIRYNFFKNIGATGFSTGKFAIAVYFDDGACGSQLYGNVFYKAGTRTVMILGGSYNPVFNNIFVECPIAFYLENVLANKFKSKLEPGGIFEARLKQVNYNRPPYSTAYPALATYFQDHPEVPKHNDIQNNVFVNIGQLYDGKKEWGPILDNNFITREDPGFVDASKQNFALNENAGIYKKLPGFKAIPFSEIGLIKTK